MQLVAKRYTAASSDSRINISRYRRCERLRRDLTNVPGDLHYTVAFKDGLLFPRYRIN